MVKNYKLTDIPKAEIGVNVGVPDENLSVVENTLDALDEAEIAVEAPTGDTKLEQLQRQALTVDFVTSDVESDRVKHYVKALYYIHGDKTEELITGFESLYGLTMLAALSGIETNNTFPIDGGHMYKANQHYKKVTKNV